MSDIFYSIKSYQRCQRTGCRVVIETRVTPKGEVVEPVMVTLSGPENLELELVTEGKEYPVEKANH